MDVSKNRGGPPKWMIYNGKPENPIKMDDFEAPLFLEFPPKSSKRALGRIWVAGCFDADSQSWSIPEMCSINEITLPPTIMVSWKMGSWKMCGLSPNGLFSTEP